MTRDSQNKLSKKDQIKKGKKEVEISRKKKKIVNSDSDDNNESDSENDELDVHEYRKFLSEIFPSKNIENKIKAGEKVKEEIKKELIKQIDKNKNKNKKTSVTIYFTSYENLKII